MMSTLPDHLFVLNFGSLIASGGPQEVLRQTDVVEAYMGGRRGIAGS
jgi:ABC-type branched-subunit amino acid transport system ATPase component